MEAVSRTWEPDEVYDHADANAGAVANYCAVEEGFCAFVEAGTAKMDDEEFGRPDHEYAQGVIARSRCVLKCEAEGMQRPAGEPCAQARQ